MSQVKSDLICEIIRASQTNLLGKKELQAKGVSGQNEAIVLEWIQNNAAEYRKHFMDKLDLYSPAELGEILNVVLNSNKDLSEILDDGPLYPKKKVKH